MSDQTPMAVLDVLRVCRESKCLELAEGFVETNATQEQVEAAIADALKARVDASKPYVLKYPVTLGNITVTELKMGRLKAKHLRGLKSGGATPEDAIKILSKLTGQLEAVIDELDGEDFTEVSSRIESFTGVGPTTGGTI